MPDHIELQERLERMHSGRGRHPGEYRTLREAIEALDLPSDPPCEGLPAELHGLVAAHFHAAEFRSERRVLYAAAKWLERYEGAASEAAAPTDAERERSMLDAIKEVIVDQGHLSREEVDRRAAAALRKPAPQWTRVGDRFDLLRRVNAERSLHIMAGTKWSPAEWGNALAGECGELCNVLKKLLRVDGGMGTTDPERDALVADARKEVADVLLYLDLIGNELGIDLWPAVVDKFNEVSERWGVEHRLPPITGPEAA